MAYYGLEGDERKSRQRKRKQYKTVRESKTETHKDPCSKHAPRQMGSREEVMDSREEVTDQKQ